MEYKFIFNTDEEKEQLIKDNSDLTLIKIAYHSNEKYLIFTDEEIVCELTENEILENKISILEEENKKINEEVLLSMLAITDMYELNKSSNTLISEFNTSKVPTYIQSTYQKLYNLGLKAINEIPFEVRINLKSK